MIYTKEAFSLKNHNTFRLDAKVRYFFEVTEKNDIPVLFDNYINPSDLYFLVLGGGSNLLFADDFAGAVIYVKIPGIRVLSGDDRHVLVEAGAGESWDDFVAWCVANEYYGLENLSGIPGNVGASPVQNIGAYGVEVKDFVEIVRGVDTHSLMFKDITAGDCRFGYRDSIFKRELKGMFIITSVVFRLPRRAAFKLDYGDLRTTVDRYGAASLSNVRQAVISIRRGKLPEPELLGNAGSFFKNPVIDREHAARLTSLFPNIPVYSMDDGRVKVSAGWLIEQCGLKGYRQGNAGVYEKQALILVNYGKSTGREVLDLADYVRDRVHAGFGVLIEPEVNIIC